VKAADAVLIATPEYNYSISGVLKNALDWASRPPEPSFDGKAVAIMGASGGLFGTARAQYDLRKIFVFMNAHVLNKPEVMIGQAASKFDAEGRLTDETSRSLITQQLTALRDWRHRLHR
jgi:chromate reductase